MNKRIALLLSAIYCGLGQIYKGEKTKGIVFLVLYTLIIVLLFFYSAFSSVVHIFILFILILMWFMGLLDTYLEDPDEETYIDRRHLSPWYNVLNVLEIIVIGGVMVTLIMATYTGFDKKPGVSKAPVAEARDQDTSHEETPKEEPVVQKPVSSVSKPGSIVVRHSSGSWFFSLQVGAFSELNRARILHSQLREKGYDVRIENPKPGGDGLYRVLIGRFDSEPETTRLSMKLKQQEGLESIVTRRR